MIVMYAEKPDIAEKLVAILGKCFINDIELTLDILFNSEFKKKLTAYENERGFLRCVFEEKEYLITWGFGHMAELKSAKEYNQKYKVWKEENFPFVPEHFQIRIKKDLNVRKQFQVIKKLFNDTKAEMIINATDSDREGQLIFDWVRSLSKTKKPCMRLWLNSYTKEEVINALHELKSNDKYINLTRAARCRSIADWLVGINLTAVGTLKYGTSKNMFPIGRVQTAVLYMIVEKEIEVRKFKKETYYVIEALCRTKDNKEFVSTWFNEDGNKLSDKEESEEIVKSVKGLKGKVLDFADNETKKRPPLLYDLTSLQMDANIKYGLTAKETLKIAQKLYQEQLLTYPRTDSRYLPKSKKVEIEKLIKSLPCVYNDLKNNVLTHLILENNRVFDDSKVNSHYAIIPTYKIATEDLNEKEIMVYGLVARSILKVFMGDAVYSNKKILLEIREETFVARSRKLIEDGWRKAEKKLDNIEFDDEEESDNEENTANMSTDLEVNVDDEIEIREINIVQKTSRAPARFTERSILRNMETCGKKVVKEELREALREHGIGTPATRADIIEKLISSDYITRKDRYLIPTEKGIKLIEKLPIEKIKSPDFTGEWEYKLSLVEKGKLSSEDFFKESMNAAVSMTEELKTTKREIIGCNIFGKCPECSDGQIMEGKKGYGCSNYVNGCKFVIWKNAYGAKITPSIARILLNGGITGKITCRKKDGSTYTAKLKLIKEKDNEHYKVIAIKA
ncbi:type IA DNA topoisomerase [Clostridium sp. CT7]|nr:type IA DNA topoisomerase [Clostridium sp. CT7]